MTSRLSHTMVLPSDDSYLGEFPELEHYFFTLVQCKYCGKNLLPFALKNHIEQSHRFPTVSNNSGNALPTVNSFVLSEVDTSSSNSSPIWESDKNNIYDSCLSSSSSNSVNIVRLKQEKSKFLQKDNVIPIQCLPEGPKIDYIAQEFPTVHHKLSPSSQISISSSPLQKSSPSPTHKLSSSQSVDMLPINTDNNDVLKLCTNPKTFECHSFFKTETPSSFVTSVKESPSEMGKTPKLIIRRVPQQIPNDVRRNAIYKGIKESSRSENLQYFLVAKEYDQRHSLKANKSQIKRKFLENHKIRQYHDDEREKCNEASEQQITLLTSQIEVLNKRIGTLNGQVGPLQIENEKYKTEIKNLRSRVEELENNTSSLVELKKCRAQNEKKIEDLKESWERERFCFTQHLEELKTEFIDYKNSSAREIQNLTCLNAYLEKKSGLHEALSENLRKEQELLESQLPHGALYGVVDELYSIRNERAGICNLLNRKVDCRSNNPAAMTQFPLSNMSSRQIVDISKFVPMNPSHIESPSGTNGQVINFYSLKDSKIQYQDYSQPVTQVGEIVNLKERENCGSGGHVS